MMKIRKSLIFVLVFALIISVAPITVNAASPSSNTLVNYSESSPPIGTVKEAGYTDNRYGQGGTGVSTYSQTGTIGALGNQKIYFLNGAECEKMNGGVPTNMAPMANTYGYTYDVKTVMPTSSDKWDNYIVGSLDSNGVIKFGIIVSGSQTGNESNFTTENGSFFRKNFLSKVSIRDEKNKVVLKGDDIFKSVIKNKISFKGTKVPSAGSARGADIFFEIPAKKLKAGKNYKLVFEKGICYRTPYEERVVDRSEHHFYMDKSIEFNFSTTNIIGLKVGASKKLKTNMSPAGKQNVTWKSSNSKIVKVSKAGKIKAVKAGKATITATTADGGAKTNTLVYVIGTPKAKIKSKSGTTVKLTWKKVKNADGYTVYKYNTKSKKYKAVGSTKGKKYTVKKLKKNSSNKLIVKAYKKINGKKVYSKASKTLKIAKR